MVFTKTKIVNISVTSVDVKTPLFSRMTDKNAQKLLSCFVIISKFLKNEILKIFQTKSEKILLMTRFLEREFALRFSARANNMIFAVSSTALIGLLYQILVFVVNFMLYVFYPFV